MAKYVEVIKGPKKGLCFFVREDKLKPEHFVSFDGQTFKKEDCVVSSYEKHKQEDKHKGCRYRA